MVEGHCGGDCETIFPAQVSGERVICLAPSKDSQTFFQVPAVEGRSYRTFQGKVPQSKADAERWDGQGRDQSSIEIEGLVIFG